MGLRPGSPGLTNPGRLLLDLFSLWISMISMLKRF
jgi:hypothetical protein